MAEKVCELKMAKSFITEVEKIRRDLKRPETVQWEHVVLHRDGQWYFGTFSDMDDLAKLAEYMGFSYAPTETKHTRNNGVMQIYSVSHDFANYNGYGGFWSLSELPGDAKPVKALSNGAIVDCYFTNDGKTITMYRPNPNAKELYRPMALETEIAWRKEHGVF